MANSIIDDMLKEQFPNNNNNNNFNNFNNSNFKNRNSKGPKKIIIISIVLLLLIIVVAVVLIFILKGSKKDSTKSEFLKYVAQGNITTILNFDEYMDLQNKMQDSSSKSESKVTLLLNGEQLGEIDNVELEVNSKKDVENNKSYLEAILNLASNELFNLKLLSSEKGIAIKSDEIVQKYVGSSYENLSQVITAALGEDLAIDPSILSLLESQNGIILPTLSITTLPKYIEVLNKNVNDTAFSSKEVTLQRTSGNINVTEYKMTLNGNQVITIVDGLLAELKNDDALLTNLLGAYMESDSDLEKVKALIESLRIKNKAAPIPDNAIYEVKVYVANNQTLKFSLNLNQKATVDIEYNYENSANGALITYLNNESNSGYTINLSKTVSDVSEKLEISLGMITDSQTTGELKLSTNLIPSQTSYKIDNKIKLSSMLISGELNIATNITFEDVEVEDLNEDNCLFIDELEENDFDATVKAIKDRTEVVMNEKSEKISFISQNNTPTEIEQPTTPVDNNEEARNEAQQKIISAVSAAMGKAQEEGREYTIADVADVVIDSDDYSISVSNNVAIIFVDGFEFTLDERFNLSY